MSTSRDRTSTVVRMWLLGDVTSSKEEGEAAQGGQGAPSTKKQEEGGGKAKDLYAYAANAMFGPLQKLAQQHTPYDLFWPRACF